MFNTTREPTPPTSRPLKKYEVFAGLDFKMKCFIYMKYELFMQKRHIKKFLFIKEATYYRIRHKAREIKKNVFSNLNSQIESKTSQKFDNNFQ